MATTIYDISITAFNELLADDSKARDVRVGDYVVAVNACSMGTIYFQMPAFVNCHGLETALDFVKRHEENDLVDYMAYEYEVWHVTRDVNLAEEYDVYGYDEQGCENGIARLTAVLNDVNCARILAKRVVGFPFVRVCVYVVPYNSKKGRRLIHDYRASGAGWYDLGCPDFEEPDFSEFFNGSAPSFSFPTKNGSILSALRGGAR